MLRAAIRRSGPWPGGAFAAALVFAAAATGLPGFAGEASTAFRITIEVLPEAAGTCSANVDSGAPQVTCRPTVVGVGATGESGTASGSGSPVVGYRKPDATLRLAGELVEIGAENHFAWMEGNYLAWGEYSSRLVVSGGIEYVEMMLAW